MNPLSGVFTGRGPTPLLTLNGSLYIGTAFGIPIRLHWSFLVLLLIFAFSAPAHVPTLLVLFLCVLLHELGHSLVARHYGIRVLDISFWPLGGMARMAEIPEKPKVEGLVAIAGPAVNFVLAALGASAYFALVLLGTDGLPLVALWFTLINLGLGTFNLIPAFPMDGGRILRAWYARSMGWVEATERAVRVGRAIAALMLLGSLILMFAMPQFFCAMPLIALFVWIAGGRELLSVRLRHGRAPFGGAAFATGGSYPSQAEWSAAGEEPASAEEPPDDSGEARRPAAWDQRSERGFDERRIRELERFRGRLRRQPPTE